MAVVYETVRHVTAKWPVICNQVIIYDEILESRITKIVERWVVQIEPVIKTVWELIQENKLELTPSVLKFVSKWGDFKLCTGVCEHYISHVKLLLKPCEILKECVQRGMWDINMLYIWESSLLGCKIVNADIDTRYDMRNYLSITKQKALKCMDVIVDEELREGIVSIVEKKPT